MGPMRMVAFRGLGRVAGGGSILSVFRSVRVMSMFQVGVDASGRSGLGMRLPAGLQAGRAKFDRMSAH